MKGRYTFKYPPSTSAQDTINIRMNDCSTDTNYPNKRYTSTTSLGEGSASVIYKGIDTHTNKDIIIKKISKKEYWKKELEVLKKLSMNKSGLVLRYLDFYESSIYSYIITEYHSGFDLFEHIDLNVPYPADKALLLTLYMAKCIKECHDSGILHLDIKCENYMVKSETLFKDKKPDIILIDFGHSEIIDSNIHKIRYGFNYGTICYTCPEGYYEYAYSSKSDIWSLGICMTLLLTGNYPFHGTEKEYYESSIMDNIKISKKIHNDKIVDLISDSLNSNPHKRPNIDEFIARVESLI